jgi:oxygen-independent coproporphyrinogen-3 oxidase
VTSWGNGAVEHLSLYSLIVEPGTPMADAVTRGILSPLDDDAAADLYEIAIEQLGAARYLHYEVANWARSEDAISVHNRVYWRNGEYLGVGAGAHGRIGDVRTMRHLLPATYIAAVKRGKTPVSNGETLTEDVQRGETMMLGLRLIREGIRFDEFERRHSASLDDVFGSQIDSLTRNGLLVRDERGVRLSDHGLLLANDVCAEFVGQPTYS